MSVIGMLDWLIGYRKEWLRPDVLAGLTSAAVVIPMAMAYATIAGLSVQVGLYTAVLPTIIYGLLGTSRALSVTTTTTVAILTAAAFGATTRPDDPAATAMTTATLSLLVGSALLFAAVLRLGFVADFISEPVLIGFKAGLGAVIVLSQVPKILGVHVPRGSFVRNLLETIRSLPHVSLQTLTVGIVMLALLVAFARFVPRAPGPLIAVAIGIAGAYLFHWQAHGVELVGRIPRGLPPITIPNLSLAPELWSGALGIALMSFAETVAAGRAFAVGDDPIPRANRELVATGFANVGGAFMGCMPAGGGTTQTAVNRTAGARTQLAGLVTGAVALLTLLLLAPVIALMPQATLAAIVTMYAIGMIRPAEFHSIRNVRRMEFIWALIALAGVVLLGTLKGIVVAIVVSLVSLAQQATDPPVYVLGRKRGTNVFRPRSPDHADDESFPGLLLLRLEGRLFFANAGHIRRKIKPLIDAAKPRVVALDFSGVTDVEYTALKMLTQAQKREKERGVSVWLVALNPEVLAVVQRSPLGSVLGREGLHFSLELAVANYLRAAA
jgi:high affinity sulfate transporter 1